EPSFSILFDFKLNPDPKISGSFTLTNLSGATQTFSVSASMSGLTPIPGSTTYAGFFGEGTLTDANLSSSGTLVSALFYQGLMDGSSVVNRGSFTIDASGGAGISNTISQEAFGPTGGGPALTNSIGVAFPGFSLTAGDSVQVPFEFTVVPEPGTLA